MLNFDLLCFQVPTLHLLLMVPDGRNIGHDGVPPVHLVHKRPMLLQHQPHLNAMPGQWITWPQVIKTIESIQINYLILGFFNDILCKSKQTSFKKECYLIGPDNAI